MSCEEWELGRGAKEEEREGGKELTVELFPSYFQGVLDDGHPSVL